MFLFVSLYLVKDCPPNVTVVPTIAATRPQQSGNESSLFKRLASTHLQSYATALAVTIAVGCFLLLLNVFIFAAIYYQREKRANYTKRKEELTETDILNTSSSPSIERYQHKISGSRKSSIQSLAIGSGGAGGGSFNEYCNFEEKLRNEKHAFVELCTVKLPMQEFKCSSARGSSNTIHRCPTPETLVIYPPTYTFHPIAAVPPNPHDVDSVRVVPVEQCHQSTQSDAEPVEANGTSAIGTMTTGTEMSPDISNAQPPPKGSANGNSFQGGILRNQAGPSTPSASKKRVQIQEISV